MDKINPKKEQQSSQPKLELRDKIAELFWRQLRSTKAEIYYHDMTWKEVNCSASEHPQSVLWYERKTCLELADSVLMLLPK